MSTILPTELIDKQSNLKTKKCKKPAANKCTLVDLQQPVKDEPLFVHYHTYQV